MQTNEMKHHEINTNEMENVSGGSIFNREASIREAGIELLKEDGTPGSFGNLWNTGDYYFKKKKIGQGDINVLEKYREVHGEVAPSLKAAHAEFDRKKKLTFIGR